MPFAIVWLVLNYKYRVAIGLNRNDLSLHTAMGGDDFLGGQVDVSCMQFNHHKRTMLFARMWLGPVLLLLLLLLLESRC